MESSAIVDYHHHKLEYVDQYKHAVIVVAPESECTLNHFIQETNVPPESQSGGESSSAAVGQSALPTLWVLGRSSTERRNGVGF